MALLRKALVLTTAGAIGLYTYAQATIPPTVYVLVSLEDGNGEPMSIPKGWGGTIYMDDGALRPGAAIWGSDDLTSKRRHRDIQRWTCGFFDSSQYAVFACHPGAEAAFACMTHDGGADEAAVQLPTVSKLLPWTMAPVTLRLPQRANDPLGELMITVLDGDGTAPDTHPQLRLSSPIARLPLLFNFGEAFGTSGRRDPRPARHYLPAGRYRIGIDQWSGLTCGNIPPSIDRHQRPDLVVDIKPGQLTQATIERTRGTRLNLALHLTHDGGEFSAARAEFLEAWEAHTFRGALPGHRWRAKATIQRLDHVGQPQGRAERYACRWQECRYLADRFCFPVGGAIEGLRHYRPGRYRIEIEGPGIESLRKDVQLDRLDGGAVGLHLALTAKTGT